MSRLRAIARVHLDAFARGPLPVLVVLGTVGGVVFGRNGLDPRDVPRLLATGTTARAISIAFIVVLTRSSSRTMLYPPGAAYLRASPIPRSAQLLAVALAVLAIQLPWALIFTAGREPIAGGELALALAAACVAPTLTEVALAGAVGVFAPILAPLVFAFVLPRAFRRAPMWNSARSLMRFHAPWWFLVALAHLRGLMRGGLTRVALAMASTGAGLGLVASAPSSERADRSVALAAVIAALGAAPLLAPVTRMNRAIAPAVRASGRSRRVPLVIAIAIVATPSLAFAAGASHLSAPAPPMIGIATASVLVVVYAHLARKRRDARLVTLLTAVPLLAVFTVFARSIVFAAIAVATAMAVSDPEVVRADDR